MDYYYSSVKDNIMQNKPQQFSVVSDFSYFFETSVYQLHSVAVKLQLFKPIAQNVLWGPRELKISDLMEDRTPIEDLFTPRISAETATLGCASGFYFICQLWAPAETEWSDKHSWTLQSLSIEDIFNCHCWENEPCGN